MSFEQSIKDDIAKDTQTKIAVADIQKSLSEQATVKAQESASMKQQASLADTADAKKTLNDKAKELDAEAKALKEKSLDMKQNPKEYEKKYTEYEERQKTLAKEQQKEKVQEREKQKSDKDNEKQKAKDDKAQNKPTVGEQIKEAFEGEGLLDKAFANALGAVADKALGQQRDKQKQPEKQQGD